VGVSARFARKACRSQRTQLTDCWVTPPRAGREAGDRAARLGGGLGEIRAPFLPSFILGLVSDPVFALQARSSSKIMIASFHETDRSVIHLDTPWAFGRLVLFGLNAK